MLFLVKTVISALLIATVSELAKRFSLFAAVVASLPIVSLLTMLWLYWETRDTGKVASLSSGILWSLIPSSIFFLTFPWLLRGGMRFGWAMLLSLLIMVAGYALYVALLRHFGIRF